MTFELDDKAIVNDDEGNIDKTAPFDDVVTSIIEDSNNPEEMKKVVEEKIKEINKKVDITEGLLPGKFSAIKDTLKEGNIGMIFSDFGNFVAYVLNILFNGAEDSDGNPIEGALDIRKLDFTKLDLTQLAGELGEDFEELKKDKNGHFERCSGSIIGQLEKKRDGSGLAKEIMYAAALSKAKDTFFLKYDKWKKDTNNPKNTNPVVEKEVLNNPTADARFQRLQDNIQPGDMVFFIGGDGLKRYDKTLQSSSSIPTQHVGMIGECGNFYHSTLKEYGTGRSGVHKVSFKKELEERRPCKLLVVRPNIGEEGVEKALEMAEGMVGVEYSKTDAIAGILRIGDLDGSGKMNCGTFVNECFRDASGYVSVKNSGVPANLINGQGFTTEYVCENKA